MKRILAMVICVALLATMAITGSIAYLQDTDSTVNTLTMGNVKIVQLEQQRKNENSEERESYKNNQPLYPAVYNNNTESSETVPGTTDAVRPNNTDDNGFWTGVAGAMDKIVSVQNVGKSEAYIRTWFAFEADNADSLKYIHINWNEDVTAVKYSTPVAIGADGNKYVVYSVTYPNPLQPGETTPESLLQVCMDKKATNEYVAQFGDTYEILVFSQGVQAANFENAKAALNEAFGEKAPWDKKTVLATPTVVKTAAELKTAIESIGSMQKGATINITLGADITLSGNWDAPSFDKFEGEEDGDITIVIDGCGYSINGLTVSGKTSGGLIGRLEGDVALTVKNLTFGDVKLTGMKENDTYCCGGALAGYLETWRGTTIENVYVNRAKIKDYKFMGGLIGFQGTGYNGASIKVSNCSVNGAKLDNNYVKPAETEKSGHTGGLIGAMYNANLDNNTVMDTTITGSTGRSGALVGTAFGGKINGNNKCIRVTVNGAQASTGNLVGTEASQITPEKGTNIDNAASTTTMIYSAADLLALSGKKLTGSYTLGADINLNNAEFKSMVAGTAGGGDSAPVVFDGNGHSISNVKIVKAYDDAHCGVSSYSLFFCNTASNLTAKNLTVKNANINATEENYGAAIICAYVDNSATLTLNNVDLQNCSVKNEKDEAAMYVSYLMGTLNMEGCDSTGSSVQGETTEKTGAVIGHHNGMYPKTCVNEQAGVKKKVKRGGEQII